MLSGRERKSGGPLFALFGDTLDKYSTRATVKVETPH